MVWPSPAIVKFKEEDSPIKITDAEATWLVNFSLLGGLISPFILLLFMNRVQRKMALLITSLPLIIGWILIALAETISIIFVARFLLGLSYALFQCILPHYLIEISTDDTRGAMLAIMIVMGKIGALFNYVVGPMISIKDFAWIVIAPVTGFILILMWIPESPYQLLSKRKEELAIKSLRKLRSRTNVKMELEQIKQHIKMSQQNQGSYKDIYAAKYRKCFLVVLLLTLIQNSSGVTIVLSYAETIFAEVGGSLSSGDSSIIFGVAFFVFSIVSLFVTDRFGRRKLLMTSMAGISGCHAVIGIYFLLAQYDSGVKVIFWLPILAMISFTFFFCLGAAVVPLVILGEIFPKHLKAMASSVYILSAAIFNVILLGGFGLISSTAGRHVSFLCLAALSLICIIICYFKIPETKGKTLLQIQEDLNFEITHL